MFLVTPVDTKFRSQKMLWFSFLRAKRHGKCRPFPTFFAPSFGQKLERENCARDAKLKVIFVSDDSGCRKYLNIYLLQVEYALYTITKDCLVSPPRLAFNL